MVRKKGFTLVELMVVVLIVGILAAVAIPMMSGRIDAAKWSEGRSAAGSIASSVRAFVAEKGAAANGVTPNLITDLGYKAADLNGTYFSQGAYSVGPITVSTTDGSASFVVTVGTGTGKTTAKGPTSPAQRVLTVANNVSSWDGE